MLKRILMNEWVGSALAKFSWQVQELDATRYLYRKVLGFPPTGTGRHDTSTYRIYVPYLLLYRTPYYRKVGTRLLVASYLVSMINMKNEIGGEVVKHVRLRTATIITFFP